MSNEEKNEYKGIVRKELLIPGLTVLLALAGFYFNTNYSIDDLKSEVSTLKAEIKGKADADDMKETIKEMHQNIRDLENSNQKILEILLEREKK